MIDQSFGGVFSQDRFEEPELVGIGIESCVSLRMSCAQKLKSKKE